MKKLLVTFLLAAPMLVSAADIEGLISLLHSPTSSNPNKEAAKGYVEFGIKGGELASPCTWLYIKPEDKNALTMLLAAQAQQRVVRVSYLTDQGAPWGATSCTVTSVAIPSE